MTGISLYDAGAPMHANSAWNPVRPSMTRLRGLRPAPARRPRYLDAAIGELMCLRRRQLPCAPVRNLSGEHMPRVIRQAGSADGETVE